MLQIVDICLSVIAGLALMLASYGGYISPDTSVLPSLAVMLFPVVLIGSLLLFVVNIFISKISLAVNSIFLIASFKAFLYYCPLNFGCSADKPADFTLLTYNVLQLEDFSSKTTPAQNPTLSFILHSGADIVALQECHTLDLSKDGVKTNSSLKDSLERKYPYRDFTAYDQALLSVYPFKRIKDSVKQGGTFALSVYEIYVGADTLTLVNVHLQSIGLSSADKKLYLSLTEGETEGGLSSEIREVRHDLIGKLASAFRKRAAQIREVIDIVSSVGGPVVVCGDFNDVTLSYACTRLLKDGFDDAYRNAAFGPSITYHANRFYFRIDHVFYRNRLNPVFAEKRNNPSSDHYPLLVGFDFNSP